MISADRTKESGRADGSSGPGASGTEWLGWLVPDAAIDPAQVARADWPSIAAASVRHHVAPALHARLQAAGVLDRVPAPQREVLAASHQRGRIDAMVWQRALRLVLPALAAAGVEAVPYKGAALAFEVYDDPASRSMSDLDFWIEDEAMQRACEAMTRLGFEQRHHPERPLALQAGYDGEIPFSGRRVGVPLVELHWGVFPGEWMRRATRIDRAAVRARLHASELFGHPVRVLAPEDHLIQIAAHAAITHVLSMATLRCLLDMAMLAHRGLDWDLVVERARAWRMATMLAHTLQLGGELFALPAFLAAAARLASPRRLSRLRRFATAESILRQDRLDQGATKWRYLAQLVDRPGDRLHLLTRSLWPEPEWMRARHGRGGARMRLLHLARALRGRF